MRDCLLLGINASEYEALLLSETKEKAYLNVASRLLYTTEGKNLCMVNYASPVVEQLTDGEILDMMQEHGYQAVNISTDEYNAISLCFYKGVIELAKMQADVHSIHRIFSQIEKRIL